jgi:replicative DNA helicase
MKNINSLEAETNVIGSIILHNNCLCEVIDILKPEDFYDLKHQIIYKNLRDMYEKSVSIDIITLSENLGQSLKEVGGISYLSSMVNSIVTTTNIRQYAEIVKEKSNLRKLLKVFNSSLSTLQKGEDTSEDLIKKAQNELLDINGSNKKDTGNMTEIMTKFMDTLQTRYENGGDIQGIKSGYKAIDTMLGGLAREDLIILAARPSMGKTSMALNILLNTVFKAKAKAAFFNLEMGTIQVMDRAISIYTGIPMKNIKSACFTEEQWLKVSKVATDFARSPIKLYDKIFTLSAIKAECKSLSIKQELDIVIIDYLQLIDSEQKRENRNQDISSITRSLKLMAKELDITIIILSQLSRAPETRADHRPMLSDLRESGSIEQDADVVLFLYRDEYYNADTESKDIIECIVAKNRNGEVGTAKLKWQAEVQRIK